MFTLSKENIEKLTRTCERCNNNIKIKDIAQSVEVKGYFNCKYCGLQIAHSKSKAIQKENLHKLDFSI